MALSQLDTIFASSACRGAFQLDGGELVSLTRGDPSVSDDAERTKGLWSSLSAFVPDLSTVIAKRDTGVSIASARGGVILETSAPVNIGMVRAALRNEAPIELEDVGLDQLDAGGTRALWALSSWIEGTETERAMRVCVGDEALMLWARKGKFGLPSGVTPGAVAKSILSANETGKPVTLSFEALDGSSAKAVHGPLALFSADQSAEDEWHFNISGLPTRRPEDASLQTTGRMLGLHAHLKSWRDGQPFEVTILRDCGRPQVIAQGTNPDEIRILLSGQL